MTLRNIIGSAAMFTLMLSLSNSASLLYMLGEVMAMVAAMDVI